MIDMTCEELYANVLSLYHDLNSRFEIVGTEEFYELSWSKWACEEILNLIDGNTGEKDALDIVIEFKNKMDRYNHSYLEQHPNKEFNAFSTAISLADFILTID